MILWERFRALSSVPLELKVVKPQKLIVDGVEKEKTSHHKPQGLRWLGWSRGGEEPLRATTSEPIHTHYKELPKLGVCLIEQRSLTGASSKRTTWRLLPTRRDLSNSPPFEAGESGELQPQWIQQFRFDQEAVETPASVSGKLNCGSWGPTVTFLLTSLRSTGLAG